MQRLYCLQDRPGFVASTECFKKIFKIRELDPYLILN